MFFFVFLFYSDVFLVMGWCKGQNTISCQLLFMPKMLTESLVIPGRRPLER